MYSQRYDVDYDLSSFIATLNIKNTKPFDIGTYHVVAENIAGKADTSCKLFIETGPNVDETAYVNPESFRPFELQHKAEPVNYDSETDTGEKLPALIVRPLVDQECYEGDTVTFVCEVKGTPKPQVNWTKNNQPINSAQRLEFNYLINEGRAYFVISNVKRDDEATYTLTARNEAGEASTSAKLKVKLVPTVDDTSYVNPDVFQQFELKKKPTQPPSDTEENTANYRIKIIEPCQDFTIKEGEQAVFSCKIDAYPKPEVFWFKDDKPIMFSQRIITNYEFHIGIATLYFKNAYMDDVGQYKCVAKNIAGTDSTAANLIVKFDASIDETSYINPNALKHLENLHPAPADDSPDDKYKKPYFVRIAKDMEVRVGTPVKFECLAFGRPTPDLVWYFNGEPLKQNPFHQVCF